MYTMPEKHKYLSHTDLDLINLMEYVSSTGLVMRMNFLF